MFRNKRRALGCALFGMLERALPFQHRPTVIAIMAQLGENLCKIHLPIAQRTEAAGAFGPARIAAIHARFAIGPEFGVLYVESFDPFVIEIDELDVIELLQHKMRRIVQDIAARMVIDRF